MNKIKNASSIIARKLNLKRPLCILDTETTGLNQETDRILEIYIHKILPNGVHQTYYTLVNPEMDIPQDAINIHGINNDYVKDSPNFREVSDEILAFIKDSDICAYNVNYDRTIINRELDRAGKNPISVGALNIDPCTIYRRKEPRSLSFAYLFYTGTPLEDAHAAEIDVNATVEILALQLDKYKDLPNNIEELSLYCNYGKDIVDPKGFFIRNATDKKIYFNFGKNKGIQALDDKNYLSWMLTKDYPIETMSVVKALLDGSLK